MRVVDPMLISDGVTAQVSLTIEGTPVSQPRTRLRRMSSRVLVFDPASQAKRSTRSAVLSSLRQLGAVQFPLFPEQATVCVNATFHVSNMQKDIDNMLKFVLDVLQGPIFANDSAVLRVAVEKVEATSTEYTAIEIANWPVLDEI